MRCELSLQAEIDLRELGDYIARDNPQRAASFVGELLAHSQRIAEQPEAYPARPERVRIIQPPGGSPAPASSWSRPTTSPPAAASAHTPAPPLPSISPCSSDLLWGTATGLRAHQRVSVQGEAGRLEEIEVIPTPKPLQAKGSISRISTKFTHVSREPVLGPSDWWPMTPPSGNKRLT